MMAQAGTSGRRRLIWASVRAGVPGGRGLHFIWQSLAGMVGIPFRKGARMLWGDYTVRGRGKGCRGVRGTGSFLQRGFGCGMC